MDDILGQAIEHIPALLLIWLTIYALYWAVGLAPFPKSDRREALLDRWGRIELGSLGQFGLGQLAVISLVSLFLELLLIRWIASEIRIFAYFKSLVLIACYLGFGLGAYLTSRPIRLMQTLIPIAGIVWLVVIPWEPAQRLLENLTGFIGWFSGEHIWNRAYFEDQFLWGLTSALIALSVVIPLFGLIAISFVPMGQLVGAYLENSGKGITAYSVNVVASIAGIWLYALLCFYATPPIVWMAVAGLILLVYVRAMPRIRTSVACAFLVICGLLALGSSNVAWWGEQSWKGAEDDQFGLDPGEAETIWSQYQKLTVIPLEQDNEPMLYILQTNDTWYQWMLDLSEEAVKTRSAFYQAVEFPVEFNQYNIPYRFYPNPPKVLIAGAGMGNDAAAALRGGAGEVTAVEIDPMIYEIGRRYHFEHPYDDPRVDFHVADARNFIQNTDDRYDLVVFSILDSHTTSSHYTNIRLDNYVYTIEAMKRTRELLADDGIFVMSFSSERPWFNKRLFDVVTEAFGHEPLTVKLNVAFFVIGNSDRVQRQLEADPGLAAFVAERSHLDFEKAEPITDDWPYLYLQSRSIPMIVLILSGGLVGISWIAFRRLTEPGAGVHWHFFFLGAAFMVLEVQIISKAALLFGTTWIANAIIISALLAFVLLANMVTAWFPNISRRLVYVGLMVSLALAYAIPANNLFFESSLVRGLAATALYCSPVFFAGLIFIGSFRDEGFRAEAFGSNLLGSLVGGLVESLSYLIGIQALVGVAALFYLLSFVTLKQVGQGESTAPPSQ